MLNLEIITALKQRAKEMLEGDYSKKLGDEEIYTLCCEYEELLAKYEKEHKVLDEFMQGKALSTKHLEK